MFATRSWFGVGAVKFLFVRSFGRVCSGVFLVVCAFFDRAAPGTPPDA